MRELPKVEKWAVYETLTGPTAGRRTVCSASEWKSIQTSEPGRHKIIREGITDESEAEKLARGTSGDMKSRHTIDRPKFE